MLTLMISSVYEGFRLWWSILVYIHVLDESFTILQDNNETKSQLTTISRDILQGFKFRFGSHFGLDIETEYFAFRIVSM